MLLHGLGANQTVWWELKRHLPYGLRIVTYDHMGCGRAVPDSATPETYADLDAYAGDLVEILEALNLTDCVVVGHSIGGMIAMLAAQRTPRIRQLVTVGSSARYLNGEGYQGGFERADIDGLLQLLDRDFNAWAARVAEAAMDPARPELAHHLFLTFSRANHAFLRAFARATFGIDLRERLSLTPVPTLVLQCAEDPFVPLCAAEDLAARLPDATLQVLGAKGHYPQLSAPSELVAALRSVLPVRAA